MNSYSTLYNYGSEGNDSAIFSAIGKFWAEGKIPYSDAFDHKGPLIFFINMLGWKIFGCVQGIIFFQILSMFSMIVFLYKITGLEINSNKKRVLFTFLTTFFLAMTYSGGNTVEEYCLPFLTGSIYFNLKYLKNYTRNKITKHSYKYAFFYGISFAVCFLTRITNAISICVGILLILIILIRNKEVKNIALNIAFFILGFLLLFVPFAIYFIINKAFYEFIYGTILYNFEYTATVDSLSLIKNGSIIKNIIKSLIYFCPSYIIFIIGAINLKKKNNIYGFYYILLGTFETILFMQLHTYAHYAIIAIPNVLISLIETEKLKLLNKKVYILYIGCIIISVYSLINNYKNFENNIPNYSLYEKVMSKVPVEERNSFIAVNIGNYRRIYEYYNIIPYYKYFVLQEWQASKSKELCEDMYEVFNNGDVTWILFTGNIEDSFIKNILNTRYSLVEKLNDNNIEDIILYHIK